MIDSIVFSTQDVNQLRDKEVADSKIVPPLLVKGFRRPMCVVTVGFLTLNPGIRPAYTLSPGQCWEAPGSLRRAAPLKLTAKRSR